MTVFDFDSELTPSL